jgi:hypothetical protein
VGAEVDAGSFRAAGLAPGSHHVSLSEGGEPVLALTATPTFEV